MVQLIKKERKGLIMKEKNMKKKKKGLAIGKSDFKEIITWNAYYIDKMKFIEEIIEDLSEFKLFTRPRRFGKTLNLSMLKYFFDLENAEAESWEDSFSNIKNLVSDLYDKKVIILINEYDTPMTSAWNEGYYEKAWRFFKSFYSNALKDNEYLQFAVVTGILRVVKEGIFSRLNNLSVYTVLDSDFSDYFGLVDNEVKQGVGILWIKSKYWRS